MYKKTIFHLARHGETLWNIENRIQGQLDSELSDLGKQQAKQLALLCQPLSITRILTSSLGRAKQTASICSQQLAVPFAVLAGIEERNFGLWQGKQTSDMHEHQNYVEITSQITDCKPEQGESAQQVLIRFEMALKEKFKEQSNEQYLIITHGDILRCFMTQFLQKGQSTTGYDYKNGQLISLCYEHNLDVFIPL